MKHLCVLLFLLGVVLSAQCSKILVVFVMPAHSHYTLGFRLANELADKGHEVTFIAPYAQKNPIPNLREIIISDLNDFIEDLKKQLFDLEKKGTGSNLDMIVSMSTEIVNRTCSNAQVKKLMNSGETFDVVIMEHFVNDAFVGFGLHFNAPVIMISPMGSSTMNNHLVGNPAPSSYIPNTMGEFTSNMNFFERVQNLGLDIFSEYMREFILLPIQRELFKTHFKTDLQLDDALYNVSLILLNSHVSVNDPVPHVPNMIEIGGYHVSPPKKLPKDLQDYLDNAKEGAILFSMGSNLKSKDLKPEVRKAIVNTFARIKQKVLWKFEEDLPEAPPNLKIMKWLPQQDILAHPNIKAFITHGGLLSTIETVYHGVPTVGIPVFGDQKGNIARAVHNGYALAVPLQEVSEETLYAALNEILTNPKYTENVKQRSRVMHDQPIKPIDAAVFWVNHVIKHRGAPHLRTAALNLAWYQRNMADIIIALTIVTIVLFVIFYLIIKKILGLICGKKTVSKKKKQH